MNKKLNNNFSLRKLLLTALVSGPLATLPAPLWALPDVTAANLTTSAGVTTQVVGSTLNVTSPDKAILTWQAFGSVGSGIAPNEIINYFLPTSSGSVLNTVSGGLASTISGQILSNGNVYILNPKGIIISPTAQINVGGFYASTVGEPSGFFAINGTLSYAGSSTENVVVQGTGTVSGTSAATIQAVGPGNNIYLAGQAVDVQGGKFFGNLFVRASSTANPLNGANVAFGQTGPTSIELVGSPLAGGGLNITSNGGNVRLSNGERATATAALTGTTVGTISLALGGTGYTSAPSVTFSGGGGTGAAATATVVGGTVTGFNITNNGAGYTSTPTVTLGTAPAASALTIAPNVTSSTGAVSINTVGNGVNGSISSGTGAITASTTGTVVTLNAGTGTTAGDIRLPVVNFLTLGATGRNITVADSTDDIVLNALTASGNASITAKAALLQTAGTLHSVAGTTTLAAASDNTIAFEATGPLTFASVNAARTITLKTTGDVVFNQDLTAGRALSVTSTGGQITANAITSGSTLTLSASSSAGKLTATSLKTSSNGGTVTIGGDITLNAAGTNLTSVNGTLAVTSSAGNITTNGINNAGTLNVTATLGSITTGIINSSTATISAPQGNVTFAAVPYTSAPTVTFAAPPTGGVQATATATMDANNQITGFSITNAGSGYTSAPLATLTGGGDGNTQLVGTTTILSPDGQVTGLGVLGNALTNAVTISAGSNVKTSGNIASTGAASSITSTGGNINTAAITTNQALSLTTSSNAGLITTGALVNNSTNKVTISSNGNVVIAGAITAPVLAVTSTTGTITQTGAITSTSAATFSANTITLTNAANDLKNIVLLGGANGVSYTDANDIIIGGGTTVTGNATITAGAGIVAYKDAAGAVLAPTVSISNNSLVTATATAAINTTTGGVSSLTQTIPAGQTIVGGIGYTVLNPAVSITGGGGTGATATAVRNTTTGAILSLTITNPGTGYTSTPSVSIAAPLAVPATATAIVNTLGVVTSVTVAPGTTMKFASAPTLTFTAPVGGTGSGASATTAVATSGLLSAVSTDTTPSQSGSIILGAAAIETLVFGGNLTLSTSGIAGAAGTTNYSVLTTPANNVTVLGNVSITTNGTAASLGSNVFGNASNYSFGQINANLGVGALSIIENRTLNLGTITAASLDARSVAADIVNTGKITVTGTTVLAANSIFSPGDVTLNFATNNITGPIEIGNARDFSLTNNAPTIVKAGSPSVNGKAATGAVNVTVTGTGNALTMTTQNGGDYSTVGFNTAGSVTISDGNGITLQNATNTGTGTVLVNVAGPVVLGSGIALNVIPAITTTAALTINSTGATASITDSTPGIRIGGNVNLTSDGQIAITQTGHSLGAVGLETTGVSGSASANITYTEGGTANLNVVKVNTAGLATAGGVLNVVSTGGSIIQTATTGSIILTSTAGVAAGSATFTSVGDVTLTNPAGTNNIAGPIVISAVGNTSIAQAQNIILGNTAVSAGTFSADNSSGATKTITQAAGTSAKIYGASTFTTQGGKITLTNIDGTGNNFGAVSARTTFTNGVDVGGAAGTDIAITEGGTLNFAQVKAGTAGKLTAISTGGDIIQTTTGGVQVGGATALTSSNDVTLNLVGTSNSFGGNAGIAITAPGNVSLQDASAITALAGGTTIGGALTLKNNTAGLNGEIKDLPGTIAVAGNVWFDTGTNAASKVTIGSSSITLGAVKFNSGTVTLVENDGINIAPGTVASGPVSLTSSGNIITSGAGGGTFQNTLTLNATGSITITNPIFVVGAGTVGLVFRALGAVNLGAVSLAGNLNGIAPTSLGASTYTPPAP